MSLRPLLSYAQDDPQAAALARDGGEAFVSPSLRAYLAAALVDAEPNAGRPAIVVAGDDRGARDLAPARRAGPPPRPGRSSPRRGAAYEPHRAPPPHLVGLRVAALDALTDEPGDEPPVIVVSAVA